MKRRAFITLLGGAAAAWPLAARAQQPTMPVVGYLGISSPEAFASRLQAFRQGLSESGYREGRNVTIEYRWAEGQIDRLPVLASDLVGRRPSLIIAAGGIGGALAVKAATTTIPIVFETGIDPVAAGLVPSLSRPGGNVTGITSLNVEVNPKRLELLHELAPNVKAVALLVNPANPNLTEPLVPPMQAAARTLGLELHSVQASAEGDFDLVFARLAQLGAGGLAIPSDSSFLSRIAQVAELGLRHRIPTIFYTREFAAAGGLASYGGDVTESHRLAGQYVGRILKGEKPGDLPVQQVTRVELIINLKTAKVLGLDVSRQLIARADEVIE
jgi:putative tryptophan/tyrosine transport system substrate-binding protein